MGVSLKGVSSEPHAPCRNLGEEGKHGKDRRCKARKKAVEDSEPTLIFIIVDSDNIKGLGFHAIKLSNM